MPNKGRRGFGRQLRHLRLSAGLTQWNVAWECEYSHSQFVSNWERGLSYPPLHAAKILARLYNVALATLVADLYEAKLADLDGGKRRSA